jgi:hypothetical protein
MTHGLNLSHDHGLSTLAGYRVVQTIEDGKILETAKLVGEFDDPTCYSMALDEAYAVRRIEGAYAVVDSVYECGCVSYDRVLAR